MSALVHVFAYGSNLSRRRLELRVGSVVVVATGRLDGHALRFHKFGKDGSAKADAYATGAFEDAVWGVVYGLDARAKRALDRYEGLGRDYAERQSVISTAAGDVPAWVYHALPGRIDTTLFPFDWYLGWVLAGAREHRLPELYIETLARHPVLVDPDGERSRRELAAQSG